MKKFSLFFFVTALLLQTGFSVQAADLANGKKLATDHACISCHGESFNTPIDPTYPKLSGQHYDYLVHALHAYRNGDKPLVGRQHAIMGAQAKLLKPAEINDIAAYISSLHGDLVLEK